MSEQAKETQSRMSEEALPLHAVLWIRPRIVPGPCGGEKPAGRKAAQSEVSNPSERTDVK